MAERIYDALRTFPADDMHTADPFSSAEEQLLSLGIIAPGYFALFDKLFDLPDSDPRPDLAADLYTGDIGDINEVVGFPDLGKASVRRDLHSHCKPGIPARWIWARLPG